ncbi:MFS transporter, SHS family, lactate transporter [Puccinia graminis f. sp. tritici CRL 75-36-700-3]|uniref:MFS transporter, SHS family, lactate transporter n=1 Tax=Puccinia graminis f. sp. tritici (strain CRL 75-36-700-3 / race SCCL) TaxID=418459 RepID=E3KBD8_PUCGT|nr:MFS transporter, SHS family, lactate transporter [Puccinia graminis f. sp. tritici CRL 75-36-700-3]EFP81651.2 MFS transporter, SHS family, lactate transporter [Puccinia graminis f. sp. tritici CRL 75-36-700-3]
MSFIQNTFRGLPRLPNKQERAANRPRPPWQICRELSARHYMYFCVGFLAWVIDAFDFFAVSVTLTRLSVQFDGRSITDLTESITLTLLFRSVGALGFGLLTDRFGRRWPLTANLVCIALLALGTAFVQTFQAFLAVRAFFGIMMGGIYGMATATALENMPSEARGLFSGILQQGYAIGYLIAASLNLSLVAKTDDWRSIFYFGACLSFLIAILRALCPESPVFLEARKQAQINAGDSSGRSAGKVYLDSLTAAVKQYWGRFVFAILLMTGFNFLSHGSQDLYPTYAQITKGMSKHQASLLTIIGNCGAITGGILGGWSSQFLGRRLAIIAMCIWTGAFIPLWILPTSFSGLALGAFFLQFGVQGAWGVVPIYLSEIAPPACLAIFTGLTYQLGNMISAASTQIEARAGELHRVVINGTEVEDYTVVQAALIGTVAGYIIIMTCFGKEYRGVDLVTGAPTSEDTTPTVTDEETLAKIEKEKP